MCVCVREREQEKERERVKEKDMYIERETESRQTSTTAASTSKPSSMYGRWESGERSEVQARSTLTSTAPKARPRSGEVATLDEVPRFLVRDG